MSTPHVLPRLTLGMVCLAGSLIGPAAAMAQDETSAPAEQPRFRQLVEGVERTIDPERSYLDLTSIHDIPELLEINPDLDFAKAAQFHHDLWALDFTFKPLRFVNVTVPDSDGEPAKKRVWYLVYNVKNPGVVYRAERTKFDDRPADAEADKRVTGPNIDPTKKDITLGEITEVNVGEPVRFVPSFLLVSHDGEAATSEGQFRKAYLDRIIPQAADLIRNREDAAREFKNTVQMIGEIPASTQDNEQPVYGLITWQDVDPNTDFFDIYAQGLTNAYRWIDDPQNGRQYYYKTLRMKFSRPGDDLDENEKEVRFLGHEWVYVDRDWNLMPEQSGN